MSKFFRPTKFTRRKNILLTFLFFTAAVIHSSFSYGHPEPAVHPLPTFAHAHNDYEQEHPLWDALHCGFTSIEVDVQLKAGVFFVAHDVEDIRPFKTLRSMYLNPLQNLVEKNNGSVYRDGSGIVLLIDMKSDGVEGWIALQKLLKKYHCFDEGAVQFLVSGNRDLEGMVATENPCAYYDGRLEDLQTNPELPIISLISAKWTDEFSWTGHADIRSRELKKLKSIIKSANDQGLKVRFWNTDFSDSDDQKQIWNLLLESGVGYIGTDKLEEFRSFVNSSVASTSLGE